MWISKKPSFGDHIRVCRGVYYHHGIYASDDFVIHFASKENVGEINASNALIITTSLNEFLMNGILEVREFTEEEIKSKRKPSDIINYALLAVGTRKGEYDLINNNCEHFANECVFGVKRSNQVEDIFSMLFGGMKR